MRWGVLVRYGVVSSYSASLKTVGQDIVYALNANGYEATFYRYLITPSEAKEQFDRGIVFIPFDPVYMASWVLLQRDLRNIGIPAITYTTVEGKPKKRLIDHWILRDGLFVANSYFTKWMIEMVGAKVIDVIPHGVNMQQIKSFKPPVKMLKKEIGAEVLFGTVASYMTRKGLDKLAMVASMVQNEIPDAKFYVLTTPRGTSELQQLKNVYVDMRYGSLSRGELLQLIGSFDYYLCTSHAEGFCLPVLEAQAMGVPVIYPDYKPISEFTDKNANFPVKVIEVKEEEHGFGILFRMHYYDIEEMANQVINAYEVYTCSPEEYEKRSKKVVRNAKKYDAVKVYKKFVKVFDRYFP